MCHPFAFDLSCVAQIALEGKEIAERALSATNKAFRSGGQGSFQYIFLHSGFVLLQNGCACSARQGRADNELQRVRCPFEPCKESHFRKGCRHVQRFYCSTVMYSGTPSLVMTET